MKNFKISIVLVKMTISIIQPVNLPLITMNMSKIRLILWRKANLDNIIHFGGL